jgi:multidrug efflux pump subunit AcrB
MVGTEVFPKTDAGQFQLRLRAPTGTRIERTEMAALNAMDLIRRTVGPENIAITTSFIGVQPSSYPVNTIYLWTSGPHEAVLLVALKREARLRGDALKEELRARFAKEMPEVKISFEAGDIVSRVMSFGADTTVEVAIQGPSLPANRTHAQKVHAELRKLSHLRDLQYAQPFDYPTLEITVDRDRAGQYGLTASGVARSLVSATSSSRFIDPGYWRDPNSGNAFQVQVEIPQYQMGFSRRCSLGATEQRQRGKCPPQRCREPSRGDVGGSGGAVQHAARGQPDGERSWQGLKRRCKGHSVGH